MISPERIKKIGLEIISLSLDVLSHVRNQRDKKNLKDKTEIVTLADTTLEDAVIDYIRKNNIPANLDGEERRRTTITDKPEMLMILDPVDGTYRYWRRFLPYSTIVTIYDTPNPDRIGDSVFAAVFDHTTGRLWHTSKNEGVFFSEQSEQGKEKKVSTSGVKFLTKDTSIMLDHGPCSRPEDFLRFRRLYETSWPTNISSAGVHLASVASGAYAGSDAYVCWQQKPEELAAGILLVENAGGVVVDFQGKPLRDRPYDFDARYETIAAATPELAEAIRKELFTPEQAKSMYDRLK